MVEQGPSMSPPVAGEEAAKTVVFAPRVDTGLREQVEGIRGITGQTVNQVGEEALRGWVDGKLADEDVQRKAMAGIEEEERRIQERKAAIVKVLGPTAAKPDEATSAAAEPGPTDPKATDTKPAGSTGSRGDRVDKKQ